MTTLTLESAAKLLNTTAETVAQAAAEGIIPGAKIGRNWCFVADDILGLRFHRLRSLARTKRLLCDMAARATEFIYVIDEGNDESPVKVGWCTHRHHIRQRLDHLRTANHRPLRLLTLYPGSREIEQFIHKLMGSKRIRGEWFSREGCVTAFVACQSRSIVYPAMAAVVRRFYWPCS
jgi:excisionase family DNA binding protein